jgi:predicted MFS family arabinose efflux permease
MKRNTTHEAIVGVAMALIVAAVALVGFFTASVVGAIVGALVGVGAIAIVGAAAAVGDYALDRRYNGDRAVEIDSEAIAIIVAMGGAAVGGFFVSNALGASYTHTLAIAVASAGAVAVLVFGGYAVDEAMRNRYTRNR